MRGRYHGGKFLLKHLFRTVNHSVNVGRQVTVNGKKCTLCGNCERICPANAIKVDKKSRKWRIYTNCRHCNACVANCPNNAMYVM